MDRSRAAKGIALAATALVVVAALAQGSTMAFHEPRREIITHVGVIERGDDYVAWMRVGGMSDHASVLYWANGTPDRVALLRMGDVDRILRGDPVEAIQEFPARTGPVLERITFGRIHFDVPRPECPPPTGGCIDATVPAVVWVKGDAWRGTTTAEAQHYTILQEGWEGPLVEGERHDGPVRPDAAYRSQALVAAAPAWLTTAAIAGAVALLALGAHVLLELRRQRAPIVPPLPRAESTETMLMLARVTTLYVDAIRRSFLVSLAAILAITTAVMAFGLPPVLERTSETFRHMWEVMEQHVALFVLTPLLVAFVTLVLWAVAYVGVRRELKDWRRRSRGFEDEAERIVGA